MFRAFRSPIAVTVVIVTSLMIAPGAATAGAWTAAGPAQVSSVSQASSHLGELDATTVRNPGTNSAQEKKDIPKHKRGIKKVWKEFTRGCNKLSKKLRNGLLRMYCLTMNRALGREAGEFEFASAFAAAESNVGYAQGIAHDAPTQIRGNIQQGTGVDPWTAHLQMIEEWTTSEAGRKYDARESHIRKRAFDTSVSAQAKTRKELVMRISKLISQNEKTLQGLSAGCNLGIEDDCDRIAQVSHTTDTLRAERTALNKNRTSGLRIEYDRKASPGPQKLSH